MKKIISAKGYIDTIARSILIIEKEDGFGKESPREWIEKIFARPPETSDCPLEKLDVTVDAIMKRFEEMKGEEGQ